MTVIAAEAVDQSSSIIQQLSFASKNVVMAKNSFSNVMTATTMMETDVLETARLKLDIPALEVLLMALMLVIFSDLTE